MAYADLPLGLNLVVNPSFESGISTWRTSGQWLNGSVSLPSWTSAYAHSGKRSFRLDGVAPQTAGMGGAAYDFDTILPEGTYIFSIWVYLVSPGNQTIVVRAGRSDIAVPPVIGTLSISGGVGPGNQWTQVSGTFTSDGIHPTSIVVRNEHFGSYGYFALDDVAVIPDTSSFHQEIYEQMTPVADQDAVAGYPLKRFLRAYSLMFDQVENYVRDAPDGTPGWGTIVNPMTAPAEVLDWLAQLGGAVLPFGASIPTKRTLIRDAPGRERGTRNAIIKSVQSKLTGTKYVAFLERSTDDNHFQVGVLKSESPVSDWVVNVATNPSFELGTSNWNTTTAGPVVAGATLTRDSQDAAVGVWSGKVVSAGANQGVWYDLGVLPAGQYHFLVSLRNATAGNSINIDYGLVGAELNTTVGPPNYWTKYASAAGIGWTSDGVTASRIFFRPTSGATIWVDGLVVAKSTVPIPAYSETVTTTIYDAVESARSVEFRQDPVVYLDDPWSYFAISATTIATCDNGEIVYKPTYGYYQDVKRHFTTYDDLKNNTPHTWENILADYADPNNEKSVSSWATSGANGLITIGATVSQDTSGGSFKDSTVGKFVTSGSTNQGIAMSLNGLGMVPGQTYSANIFLQSVTTAANVDVLLGSTNSPTTLFSGSVPTSGWTQVQGQFVYTGDTTDYFIVRCPLSAVRTVRFDMYAVTPGVFTFPSTAGGY